MASSNLPAAISCLLRSNFPLNSPDCAEMVAMKQQKQQIPNLIKRLMYFIKLKSKETISLDPLRLRSCSYLQLEGPVVSSTELYEAARRPRDLLPIGVQAPGHSEPGQIRVASESP